MNYYSISQFINFATMLALGLFVVFFNYKNKVNISYALLNFSMAFWCLFWALWNISIDYNLAFLYVKILMAFAITIPVFYAHFVFNLLNIQKYKVVIISSAYLMSFICEILNFSNLLYDSMAPKMGFMWWPNAKPLFTFYLFYFYAGILVAFTLLIIGYFKSYGIERNRSKYMLIAASCATLAGSLSFPLWYDINIPPALNPLFIVYAVVMAYAILKHHIMDITVIIRKGLLYSTEAAAITGLYVAFLTFFNQFIIYGNVNIKGLLFSTLMLPIQTFMSGVAVLFVGIFVLIKNNKSKINIIFFIFCLSVFVWLFSFTMMHINQGQNIALKWAKLGDIGILYLPILSYYFTLVLLNKDKGFFLKLLYFALASSIPILFLTQTDYFFIGMRPYKWGHYPLAGPLYILLIMFFSLYVISICLQYYALNKQAASYDQRKLTQIKYVLIAFIGGCTGFVDYLPKYNIPVYPWGHISSLIFILIIAYAILKHHLMDIIVVIRKGLLYSLLAGLLSALYLSVVFIFGNYLGGRKSAASILFTIFSIIFFSLIFQPLRDRIQEMIDKLFFRGKYDYQKTLKELSLTARSIAGIEELADKILISIAKTLKINRGSIHVLDNRTDRYYLRRSIGGDVSDISPELVSKLSSQKEPIIHDNTSGDNRPQYAIVFPIMFREKLVGVLSLGEKLSGDVYSDEDIDLLTTLCNQMGVSIENAMLYEDSLETQKQLYQADKLATVGTLAAGLAHEIKNPLAAIKGFSQMIDKAVKENDKEALEDFKNVVPRQLDRINEIVEKLLVLSKPQKLEKQKVNLNNTLNDIIRLVEKQAMKQKVAIVRDLNEIPEIMADPQQLTQAFLNLILNAVQSMPDGGEVKVVTSAIASDVKVEVIDNGVGIPKDKIGHVFDPFYTTKPGGSGLGLAVTRKMIMDHHGKIDVISDEGKGAKFSVELPLAQA